MECANTYHLNKYLDKQEEAEKALESFEASIADSIQIIEDEIKSILTSADDFYGYDFTEDAKEMIRELI